MTGLKGQSKPAQGKRAKASVALGSRHQSPARPEGARVRSRFCPASFRPFRADSPFADVTQGDASLALGWFPLPRWGNRCDRARHDRLVGLADKMLALVPKLRAATPGAERATLQNAVTATDQQIDALVYDLYGLTAEEIKLVEGAA